MDNVIKEIYLNNNDVIRLHSNILDNTVINFSSVPKAQALDYSGRVIEVGDVVSPTFERNNNDYEVIGVDGDRISLKGIEGYWWYSEYFKNETLPECDTEFF